MAGSASGAAASAGEQAQLLQPQQPHGRAYRGGGGPNEGQGRGSGHAAASAPRSISKALAAGVLAWRPCAQQQQQQQGPPPSLSPLLCTRAPSLPHPRSMLPPLVVMVWVRVRVLGRGTCDEGAHILAHLPEQLPRLPLQPMQPGVADAAATAGCPPPQEEDVAGVHGCRWRVWSSSSSSINQRLSLAAPYHTNDGLGIEGIGYVG